jgi:hypothetical protein
MSGSLKTAARESVKCTLHLMGVQENGWDKGGTKLADDYSLSVDMGMLVIIKEQAYFVTDYISISVETVC